MVGILLLKDRDRALSSDRVNTLAGRIIEHVVTVPNRGHSLDNLPCEGIQHDHARGNPADDKQPVIRFVQSHWVIRLRPSGCPGCKDRSGTPVDYGDLLRLGKVDEDSRSSGFELKGLRVRI